MAKCSVCGRSVLFGNKVSHSHRRANKMFRANIKRVRIQTDKGNKKVYVCTSCLRSGAVKRAVYTPSVSVSVPVAEEANVASAASAPATGRVAPAAPAPVTASVAPAAPVPQSAAPASTDPQGVAPTAADLPSMAPAATDPQGVAEKSDSTSI